MRLRERFSATEWTAFVIVGVLSIWTMPSAVYGVASVTLWFGLSATLGDTSDKRRDLQWLSAAIMCAAAALVAMYLPALRMFGLRAFTANPTIAASTWPGFVAEMPGGVRDVFNGWAAGVPFVIGAGLVVLACVGVVAVFRRPS